MKLSCLPVSLYDDIFSGKSTIADWIRFGAELGLDAVDFSIKFFPYRAPYHDKHLIDSIRTLMTKRSLEACMLACYCDFTHPDSAQRAQELTDLKSDIILAKDLGASFIRVTAGQNHPGINRDEGIKWVTEGFRRALDEAEKHGITLAYENHTKGAPWQYWDFSQPTEVFLQILDELSDTPLGVCFDTANPLVLNEDVMGLLEQVIDRVVVLHVFDMHEAGSFDPVRVGTGVSPIPQVFQLMRHNSYDGWLSIEEASKQGRQGFKAAVQYVRKTWEQASSA